MAFQMKEVVWAKVKGYPWWPAVVNKLPDDTNANFKVLFIAEDNYAFLDPRSVKKYEEHYRDFVKVAKTKKLLSAIQKADAMLKNKIQSCKKVKKTPSVKEIQKQQPSQHEMSQQDVEDDSKQQSSIEKDAEMSQPEDNFIQLEKEGNQLVGRQKIQLAQAQLHKVVAEFQNNGIKQWKNDNFFKEFKTDHLNSEQLLQSNLTRMIRYIINRMKECNVNKKYIEEAENVSKDMKDRIMSHLTNTSYYDQYLRVVDRNKQNKADIESHISKTLRKISSNKVKKQFIQLFVHLIGNSVTSGIPFKQKQFLADLKDKRYDVIHHMISKAATQRFADQIIHRYL